MIPGVRHSPRRWPRAQHSPRWQQEPQTPTQILAVARPQIRTWPPNTVQAWTSPLHPRVGAGWWWGETVRATSICTVSPDSNLTLGCHRWWPRPQASALPSVATMALRPWTIMQTLALVGPGTQLKPGCLHNPGRQRRSLKSVSCAGVAACVIPDTGDPHCLQR